MTEVKRVLRSGVFPDGHVGALHDDAVGEFLELDRRGSSRGRGVPAKSAAGEAPDSGSVVGAGVTSTRCGRGHFRTQGLRDQLDSSDKESSMHRFLQSSDSRLQRHGAAGAAAREMDKMMSGGTLPGRLAVRLDSGGTKPEGVSRDADGRRHSLQEPAPRESTIGRGHEERQLRSARLVQPGRAYRSSGSVWTVSSADRIWRAPRRNTPTSWFARTASS